MDLQSEERETGMRWTPKCVGFKVPTKDERPEEARAARLPPDPASLLSGSRQPTGPG